MNLVKSVGIFLGIVILVLLFTALFQVREGQQALLLRLGKLVTDSGGQPRVYKPGLHFKTPFINRARIFDTRIQTLAIDSSRVVTVNKKDVLVDYYIKWRISNLPLFYTRTGGSRFRTETLLQQKLNDGLRAQFGRRTIQEVVASDRTDIMAALSKAADESARSLGVDIIDVRIKGIDLPPAVRGAVFDRMRAERERVAAEHRAEGKAQGERIRANADREVTVVLANAKRDGSKLRAEGDAKAAIIYAKSFQQNPEFYAFKRSLDAYREAFRSKDDMLVLNPQGQFFKYFNKAKANGKKASS